MKKKKVRYSIARTEQLEGSTDYPSIQDASAFVKEGDGIAITHNNKFVRWVKEPAKETK